MSWRGRRSPAWRWWRSPTWRRRHPGPGRHCSGWWRRHPGHWRSSSHRRRRHWMGSWRSWGQWRAGHEALAGHHVGRRRNHVWRWRDRGDAGQWSWGGVSEQLVRSVSLGQRVLGSQQSLSCRAVSLTLRVLLEGVRDGDGSVAQILAWKLFKINNKYGFQSHNYLPFIASMAASEASKLA